MKNIGQKETISSKRNRYAVMDLSLLLQTNFMARTSLAFACPIIKASSPNCKRLFCPRNTKFLSIFCDIWTKGRNLMPCRIPDAGAGSHRPLGFPWGPIPPIRGKCPAGTKGVGTDGCGASLRRQMRVGEQLRFAEHAKLFASAPRPSSVSLRLTASPRGSQDASANRHCPKRTAVRTRGRGLPLPRDAVKPYTSS